MILFVKNSARHANSLSETIGGEKVIQLSNCSYSPVNFHNPVYLTHPEIRLFNSKKIKALT